jgi:DNA-binding CsgD family transcriptional regulator
MGRGREGSTPREARVLRDACHAITTIKLGAPPCDGVAEALQSVVNAKISVVYSLKPRVASNDLAVDWLDSEGFPTPTLTSVLDRWLRNRGVNVAGYNPLRPEPEQRNRVVAVDDADGGAPNPMRDELYPQIDARGYQTMRVLICDGQSLLGYAGFLQPTAPTAQQRRALSAVRPYLRQRFEYERLMRSAATAVHALDAAMEEISAPALVVDAHGSVRHANAPARASYSRGFGDDCSARQVASDPRFRVVGLADGGYLAVGRTSSNLADAAVEARATEWRLTPAQRRVLAHLALGYANRTIAAELGVHERTVEAHLTAIFEKAQVSTRAALLSQLLTYRR